MLEGGKQILLLLLIIEQGESFLESPEPLTWIAAQKFCSDRQESLIPGTKEGFPSPHWTGFYHRLSDWIHVLGCHGAQTVEDLGILSNYTLDRGSVGLCQERCESSSFALQNTTCLCLRETPQINSLSPSQCDYNCPYDDDSHANDCGGSNAYNVYRATSSQTLPSEQTVNCVVLGCYEQYAQIHTNNCTEDLGRVCESEASTNKTIAPDEENFKSWNQTYTECREKESYLYGNVSLNENPRSLCNKLYNIKSNTPETWLGVARQVFQTKDRGQQLSEQVVIDCSICQGPAGCSYVENCNSDSMKATAICGNEDDLLPPTQGTGETSTMTSTSRAITAAPAPKTGIGDDAKQAIAITVSLVVVVAVLVIIGVVCIRKRRQKSGKPDEVPGEKFGKNIAIGSEGDKVHVSVDSYKKENIKSKTSVPEPPTPVSTQKDTSKENPPVSTQNDTTRENPPVSTQNDKQRENPPVSTQRDTGNETSKWKDKKQLKESEVVAGTSSKGNTDEAETGPTDGLLQKPTTEIDKEKKLYDNTQMNTENKLDNKPNNKDSPEDKSKIMKMENAPYYTDIIPENKAEDVKDSEEIPTDIESTKTKEAAKISPEDTKHMEINVPYVDKSKTSQSKDDEVKRPVVKATTDSVQVPTGTSGTSVNKKNVSIIQVSKF